MKRRSFLSVLGMSPALVALPSVSKNVPVVKAWTQPAAENISPLDRLTELDNQGVPIPMRVCARAAGINYDLLLKDIQADAYYRQLLSEA